MLSPLVYNRDSHTSPHSMTAGITYSSQRAGAEENTTQQAVIRMLVSDV